MVYNFIHEYQLLNFQKKKSSNSFSTLMQLPQTSKTADIMLLFTKKTLFSWSVTYKQMSGSPRAEASVILFCIETGSRSLTAGQFKKMATAHFEA